MKTDAGEQFIGQGLMKEGAVDVGSLNRVAAKRKPTRVGRQRGVPVLAQIGWQLDQRYAPGIVGKASTPWAEVGNSLNHSGTDGLSIGLY